MASDLKATLSLNDKNFSARLDSACKKAQNSLGQVAKTTKGLGGVLGSLGGQVGGTIGSLTSLAGSFSSLINPVTASVAALGLAAKAFFDYNKNLEETKRLTEQFTGLDGNQLSSLRNGVQALADTTGKDFKDILAAVDQQARTFGISFEEAFQQIQGGFVAGADLNGTFLESLGQYKAVFKDLGLAGDEFVAVVSQTRQGLFDENGLAAIQMASKNLGNLSSKTKQDLASIGVDADAMAQKVANGEMTQFQALQQVAGALKNTNRNAQEYGAVLQDVFGKKGVAAGSAFVDTLADMTTDLDEAKAKTGEQGQVMDELINTTREWNNACETLFGNIGSGFADFGKKAKTVVLANLTKIINKFVDVYNRSVVLRGAIQFIALQFKLVWDVCKAVFRGMLDGLKALGNAISHVLTGDFDKLYDDWKQGVDAFGRNIVTTVQEAWSDAQDAVGKTLNGKIEKVEVEADVVVNDDNVKDLGGGNDKTKGKGGNKNKNKDKDKDKNKPPEYAKDSIEDLQNRIQALQKAWKSGLYTGTLEQWKKEVADLQKQLDEKLAEIGEGKVKIDPSSYEGLGQQISDLKSKYAQGLLDISPEEYEAELKRLTSEQYALGVKLKITNEEDFDKQIDDILEDNTKSTFEIYVKPEVDKSFGGILSQIQEQMNANDSKIQGLEDYRAGLEKIRQERGSLTEEEQAAYNRTGQAIEGLKQKNVELGEQAAETNKVLQSQEQTAEGFNTAADAANNLGSVLSAAGAEEAGAIVGIASSIAQTIGSVIALMTANGVKSAMALPFPANLAAAATVMAGLASIIGQIKAAMGGSFAQGGIVGGGKYYGDKNIVHVDSGEMILNRGQQGRLWNMINSNTTLGSSIHDKDNVQFVLRGSDLYGSISNYKKISKK